QLHIICRMSQAFKPIEDRAVTPGASALPSNRFDLGESVPFHLKVDRSVLVCSVGTGVTQPLTDSRQDTSGIQGGHRRAMPQAVRMKSLATQASTVNIGAVLILS